MNKKTIFSFIMPCYQDGKHIQRAVESILNQDVKDIEVILIDDGSKDNSKLVIKSLEQKYDRVKAIYFSKNKGACVARNAGAKIAKGKFYAHLPADAMLYPGVVRIWMNAFEDNPDCDFVYGGYRFTTETYDHIDNMDYFFERFDPYTLEVSNYIDGTFPIRAKKYWETAKKMGMKDGLWDKKIKSLQDWDFWLSIVKKGGKGFYIPDIFFETVIPRKGGLSYDSAENWIARTDAIKKKHGILDRRLCVASVGAPWHGINIAKMLDADYKGMPSFKFHKYDALYIIGFYPEYAAQQDQMFLNNLYKPEQGRTPAKKIIHLVGSDVWQLFHVSTMSLKIWRNYFKNAVDEVLCESQFIKDELEELGIENVKVVPLPPKKLYKVMSLPKKFTVAVYQPAINAQFYRPTEMEQIAKACPDIDFKFFGNAQRVGKRKLRNWSEDENGNRVSVVEPIWDFEEGEDTNIEDMGYIEDMDKFILNCSAIIRFPQHDGLPLSVLEFITAGRYAVTSVEIAYSKYIKDFKIDNIVKELKRLQGIIEPNKEGSEYWRKELDHNKYRQTMKDITGYNPKQYWENRAKSWDTQATDTPWDTEEVKKMIDKISDKIISVVDMGCGNGKWYPLLSKLGTYTGFDISTKLVNIAQDKYPEGVFVEGKIEDFIGKFDLAFSYTTLEHIKSEDFFKAVINIKKIAKWLLLVEPIDFETRYYCYNHNYKKHFNVVEEMKLKDKTIMLCKNR